MADDPRPFADWGHVATDLALEMKEALQGRLNREIPGVAVEEETFDGGKISRVSVLNAEGERRMNKVRGNYITIEAPELRRRNRKFGDQVAAIMAKQLARLVQLGPLGEVLVVGLGNWNATPDSLGPKVVSRLLVTRHLKDYVPSELTGGLRGVAAVAPGVLGLTGIETGEIVRGIVERIRPDLVIAIDALAARSMDRVATTIQLADTGINPGSGVGNRRMAINSARLGCPVIAVGVPTVVHAFSIARDTVEMLVEQLRNREPFYQVLDRFDGAQKTQLLQEVLSPTLGDMVVTPKEIDVLIDDLSAVLAAGLNAYLHPNVDKVNMELYIN